MSIYQFLKFEPILKEKIWGGDKLVTLLNKKSDLKNIGESWEISSLKEAISVVANKSLKGTPLKNLINKYKDALLGGKVYEQFGDEFPLLIKFIDAKKALSIQLHPNNELAKKRHDTFGKNEMWYVVQAEPEARLILGLKNDSNLKEYLSHLEQKKLLTLLNTTDIEEGDAFFIPTGTIHAIGAGSLIAEIQQTSDITYRIYDWERPDKNGLPRALHTEEAKDAIDYSAKDSYKAIYSTKENTVSEIISCPYFTTNILPVYGRIELSHFEKDSFVVYMCVSGAVAFQYEEEIENLQIGETILIPACMKKIQITAEEKSVLLEVYIK